MRCTEQRKPGLVDCGVAENERAARGRSRTSDWRIRPDVLFQFRREKQSNLGPGSVIISGSTGKDKYINRDWEESTPSNPHSPVFTRVHSKQSLGSLFEERRRGGWIH